MNVNKILPSAIRGRLFKEFCYTMRRFFQNFVAGLLVFFENFVTSGSNLTVQHSAAYFFDDEFSTFMSSIIFLSDPQVSSYVIPSAKALIMQYFCQFLLKNSLDSILGIIIFHCLITSMLPLLADVRSNADFKKWILHSPIRSFDSR